MKRNLVIYTLLKELFLQYYIVKADKSDSLEELLRSSTNDPYSLMHILGR